MHAKLEENLLWLSPSFLATSNHEYNSFIHFQYGVFIEFPGASAVKNPPAMQEMQQEPWVQSLGREDLLEKDMTTHSSILAWEIPLTEEPGGPQSMGFVEWGRKELDAT